MPIKPKILMVLLLLAGSFAFAAPATDLPFLAWKRACHEPILSPHARWLVRFRSAGNGSSLLGLEAGMP